MTELSKAERWDRIAAAWHIYCHQGPGGFDWDYDSRTLMEQLTDDRAFSDEPDDCATCDEIDRSGVVLPSWLAGL